MERLKIPAVSEDNAKSISHKVISGYSQQYYVPQDIIEIIDKYFHSFFVVIRYSIDDVNNGHIITIDKDMNFLSIAKLFDQKEIDKTLDESDEYIMCNMLIQIRENRISRANYNVYTRLWVPFLAIKAIYPYHTKKKKSKRYIYEDHVSPPKKTFNIEIKDVDKVNKNHNRFVEIPDDYYNKIKIQNVMKRIEESINPNYILEIVVEKYDKMKQIWPIQKKINNSKCTEEWRDKIQIGDIIDIKDDKYQKWYQSFVRYIEIYELSKDSIKIIMEGITSIKSDKLQEYKTKLFNESLCVWNTKTIYVHCIGATSENERCRKFASCDLEYVAKRNSNTNGPYRHPRIYGEIGVPNIYGDSSESSESEYF